jgi:chemotaxis protein MotA
MNVPNWEEERIISRLVAFSEKARREGLLALEDDLEEVEDEFLRKGIQLVVDGTDPDIIKSLFGRKRDPNIGIATGSRLPALG